MAAGELKVKKSDYNTISIEWKLRCMYNKETHTSQPFALISDLYHTSFFLSLYSIECFEIRVHCSVPSRFMMKLSVEKGVKNTVFAFVGNSGGYKSFDGLGYLSKGAFSSLTINCDITWLGSKDANTKPQDSSSLLPIANVTFDRDQNPDFAIVINNKKLLAHKLILAGYSSVLAAMFRTPMRESKENEMTIKNVEYSAMETVLNIIYTGVTDDLNDIDTALKVLQVSEMYQMAIVKSACERKLQLMIKDDNAVRLLEEADKHNAIKLCCTCVEYIVAHDDNILPRLELEEMAKTKQTIKNAVCQLGFSLARFVSFKKV